MIIENTKKSIHALRILVSEDFTTHGEIAEKIQAKIGNLILIEDDEEVKQAIRLLQDFLREMIAFGKRVERLDNEESFFENALKGTTGFHRNFILKKLEEIDGKKTTIGSNLVE